MAMNRLVAAFEPWVRRAHHFYRRVAAALTLGVRAAVIDGEGRVFLIKHSYVAGWHMPGGGVEVGETLLDALARELREEGNIRIIGPPTLHGIFHNPTDSIRDHVALFIVRSFRQDAPPVSNYEIVGHGWFDPDALPEQATPATRRRVAEIFKGAPIPQRW